LKNKEAIIQRIVKAWGFENFTPGAWGFNYDTENRFPEESMQEDMEGAASLSRDIQPKKNLRNRQYGDMPLIVRPKYQGDFLDKLREQVYKNKTSENIQDYSNPEEMLKYMPEVIPRDLTDGWYEHSRPGDGIGNKTIQEYSDRGWDPDDAPEMSEDKNLNMRNRTRKFFLPPVKKSPFSVKKVLAKYLMRVIPSDIEIDCAQVRVAKILRDFESSLIYSKPRKEKGITKGGWRKPDMNGVRAMITKAEPEKGLYTFQTGTKNYSTIFQFIPQGEEVNPNKLQVRVTCSCPSWLFWGAQFNSVKGDYHYGEIEPVFAPPTKRDPYERFLVCKHVLACSRLIARNPRQFSIESIPKKMQKQLQKEPPIKVKIKKPKEKIKIPAELKFLARRPNISKAVKEWSTMDDKQKKAFIDTLPDANSVAFFAFRFPNDQDNLEAVIYKLKNMAVSHPSPGMRTKAKSYLASIIG